MHHNKHALEITNLTKEYTNNILALKGINLTVEKGDFFALLGPNGAGKSTAINIIASLVNKTSGSVVVMGYDLECDTELAKYCIGLVPQEFNFNQFEKVLDIVVNSAGFYGVPKKEAYARAKDYLIKLNLWDKRNEVSRRLSGGMKRRLMIARALVHEPAILILDEPTAGVDVELRRTTWGFLKEINEQKGITIILTTHYLEEAENLCKKIAIINNGLIIENTTIKKLLSKLNKQTFIIETEEEIISLPHIDYCQISKVDATTLEVVMPKGNTLNRLLADFSNNSLKVITLRNKENRLESLFVDIISGN